MKYYALFDTETGEILQTGNAPELETLPYMVRDGQDYLVRDEPISAKTHRVSKDRRVIAKGSKDVAARELAEAWRALKMRRSQFLAASDWTQMPDAPVNAAAWRAYRQALRDLPQTTKDPRNPEWPEPPK